MRGFKSTVAFSDSYAGRYPIRYPADACAPHSRRVAARQLVRNRGQVSGNFVRESTIRRSILKWLNSLPESYFEVSPPGSNTGKPDLTGALAGKYVAIEVKCPGKNAERHQEFVHRQLRKAGAVVFVAHSLTEAKAQLAHWMRR